MKKSLVLISVFCAITLMAVNPGIFASSTLSGEESIPKSAVTPPTDFMIPLGMATPAYETDSVILLAGVMSPSGSMPTTVIGCVNGTNYTLSPYYDILGSNISTGIFFVTSICGLLNGSYTVKFYALNATNQIGSATNASFIIDRKPFNTDDLNNGITRLCKNQYEFSLSGVLWNGSLDVLFQVFMNGTSNKMTYNATRNKWIFAYDFGDDSTNKYIISFNITYGTTSWQSMNYTLQMFPVIKESSIDYAEYRETYNGSSTIRTYYPIYSDWNCTFPQKVNVSVNGVSTSLSTSLWKQYYAHESYEQGYCAKPDFIDGAVLDPFSVTLLNATTYNVTLFAYNGTEWVNTTILDNETIFRMIPQFNVTILNSSLYINGVDRKWNITISVNFTGSEVSGIPIDVSVFYITPIKITSTGTRYLSSSMIENNIADTNLADGKLYHSYITMNDADEPIWGDILYTFRIVFSGLTTQGSIISTWFGNNYTYSGNQTNAGQYDVKSMDYFISDGSTTSSTCILGDDQTLNTTTRSISRLAQVKRFLGADYFMLEAFEYDYCYKMWTNQMEEFTNYLDPFGLGVGTFYWVNKDDNESLLDSPILPKNFDLNLLIMMKRVDSSFNYTLSGRTITQVFTYGCATQKVVTEYDARGYAKTYTMTQTVGTCFSVITNYKIIATGNGALPANDGTPGIDGYPIFMTFGLLVASVAIVSIYLRKRIH